MRIKLTKGLDLRLAGALSEISPIKTEPVECAILPEDYPGFRPKLDVAEGDVVMVGSALMHDKVSPSVCLVSPVSGTVKQVVRGERRKILRIVIANDGKYTSKEFDMKAPLPDLLGQSGLFCMIRRRPFDIVSMPEIRPRDIFVTCFDSAPLAMPLSAQTGEDALPAIERAVKALKGLTDGNVYLCTRPGCGIPDIQGARMVEVSGPHPAGNPGIQIANIAPVNKGENVWALDIVTLWRIGRLLSEGKVDYSTITAVTGPEVETPYSVKTYAGADMRSVLVKGTFGTGRHLRFISGNVLTGTTVSPEDGYLHSPWRQVTVIAEGDDVDEFMGWASVSPSKLTVHRALPFRWLRKTFSPDARLQGGRRAMIMSGEYDRVMPADIMVEYLLKAIISKNIDDMEALGIYEVAPEDLALCEFVDTSKLPVQQIVRDGLDYLRKETE